MFKLIFRTVIIIVFVTFVSMGLAVWKGGEPFRWIGEKAINTGRTIQRFGDYIDGVRNRSQQIKKTYDAIKETLAPEKGPAEDRK